MADDWPFDADQHDPLAKLRIPVVRNPYPGWTYAVCLMIDTSENALWPSLRPDEAEIRQLTAFLGYLVHNYVDRRAAAKGYPFDIDGGVNTVTLRKRPDGGWCYRKSTWQPSADMAPPFDAPPVTLETLLDGIFKAAPKRWDEWKARYPGVFGGAAA